MKKVWAVFSLAGILSFVITTVSVAEQLPIEDIKSMTDKAKKECAGQAFPEDENDYMYALYDDSLKRAEQKYAQCMKKKIFLIIDDNFSKEDAHTMKTSLNKIEENILQFYWVLNGKNDGGTFGRLQNDVEYSRRLDDILYDINLRLHTY